MRRSPWGAWASALGGLGSVAGNGNCSTLTYNFGGVAAGIDYRARPALPGRHRHRLRRGNQWVDSFIGRGWTDRCSVAAYGASFTQGGFYPDALAGYAYYGNQMQRQIIIPGLQPRTANGSTGANQFLGQVEAGYKRRRLAPAPAHVTPFAPLPGRDRRPRTASANGAPTRSASASRSRPPTRCARCSAPNSRAPSTSALARQARPRTSGWAGSMSIADTDRPVTAAFAGAPCNAFTVYGATPQRDAAIDRLRGQHRRRRRRADLSPLRRRTRHGTDNHALNLGVRFTW